MKQLFSNEKVEWTDKGKGNNVKGRKKGARRLLKFESSYKKGKKKFNIKLIITNQTHEDTDFIMDKGFNDFEKFIPYLENLSKSNIIETVFRVKQTRQIANN